MAFLNVEWPCNGITLLFMIAGEFANWTPVNGERRTSMFVRVYTGIYMAEFILTRQSIECGLLVQKQR
jgi:hypothetical protein